MWIVLKRSQDQSSSKSVKSVAEGPFDSREAAELYVKKRLEQDESGIPYSIHEVHPPLS